MKTAAIAVAEVETVELSRSENGSLQIWLMSGTERMLIDIQGEPVLIDDYTPAFLKTQAD